ncbi:MAG: hypothetical protein R6V53_00985 [Candidatus Woesearchaeota archaeon]
MASLEELVEQRRDPFTLFSVVIIFAGLFIFALSLQSVSSPTGFAVQNSTNNTAPQVINITGATLSFGSSVTIDLDNYVYDSQSPDSELMWDADAQNLDVEMKGKNATITAPQWVGTETIVFTVTDPQGLSNQTYMDVTVESPYPINFSVRKHVYGYEGEELVLSYNLSGNATLGFDSPFQTPGTWTPPDDYTKTISNFVTTITASNQYEEIRKDVNVTIIDKKAPEITDLEAYETNPTNVTLRFRTDEPCYGRLKQNIYEIRSGYSQEDVPDIDFQDPYEHYQFVTESDLTDILNMGKTHLITITGLSPQSDYTIPVYCFDVVMNSPEVNFAIQTAKEKKDNDPIYDKFNGSTTNLTYWDASNECDAILEMTGIGMINLTDICINFTGLNLDEGITLEENYLDVTIERLQDLEPWPEITFYGVDLDDPGLLREDEPCIGECMNQILIEEEDEDFSFRAKYLTEYELVEKTSFNITANDSAYAQEPVLFIADYRYYDKLFSDYNGSCHFTLGNKTSRMESDDTFYHSHTFNDTGNFSYNITCNTTLDFEPYEYSGEIEVEYNFFCGDGTCDSIENCSTCPEDCGQCTCEPDWNCTEWSECEASTQYRECTDLNGCNKARPNEERSCDSCDNGIQDSDEEDIDCGGPCDPCETEPTCDDGILNQGEEEVDCGGPCDPCETEPTCDDGILNQGEEEVDCGGPCDPCETEPQIEEPSSLASFLFLGIIIVVLLVGGGAVYYMRDEPYIEPYLEKIGLASPPRANPQLVGYIQQNLMQGYDSSRIKSQMLESGWKEKVVEKSFEEAQRKVDEFYINQLVAIISQFDLRKPEVVMKILSMRHYPKPLLKEAVSRVLKKYPLLYRQKLRPYLE